MRLRTLPLSLSCIFLGTFLAYADGFYDHGIALWATLTILFLQILSNLANDYGDGVKGTDNAERIGPERAMQSGALTATSLRKGIIVCAGLALASGLLLLHASFGKIDWKWILFFGLGVASIWAAVQYTVGKRAYGYMGLGDLFVLIFFGWVGVGGTYYLFAQSLSVWVMLPATAMGLMSMGVLNLNNMRDRVPDQKAGKITLAVRLGAQRARYYHAFLLSLAVFLSISYTVAVPRGGFQNLYVIAVLLLILNIRKVFQVTEPRQFDPLLKQMALTALVYALTFGLGQVIA